MTDGPGFGRTQNTFRRPIALGPEDSGPLAATSALSIYYLLDVEPHRWLAPYPSQTMRIAFAADHAGAVLKDELLVRLLAAGLGHELVDLGGDGSDPTDDYPDFAQRLGNAIVGGEADRGILICGSGVGASVAANKIRGIRAAVCHDTYSAHQGVEHDDMNVLTLGARVIGPEPAFECALAFIGATFSGEVRHQRRLDKVLAIEANQG